ncbi:MAG TPA: tetratricopeptide repeat protein [Polyangiaceae bacterium]|nr:tetratricopeptide repeat protein [Polyangiaceae bacterium]
MVDPTPRTSAPKTTPRRGAAAFAVAITLFAARGHAETSASKGAAAEALFEQGTALMAQGDYEKACERFEGSLEIDSALGTLLRLADCYDRLGKTASAWSLFKDAASVAKANEEPDRLQIAEARAEDAERRLSKLKVRVVRETAPGGLIIRLNGVVLPKVSWDVAVPVDPGPQLVQASAPDRTAWSTTVNVPKGPETREIVVPPLAIALSREAPLRVEPRASKEATPFYTDWLGDTLLLGGAAAAAVGTVLLVKGDADMRDSAGANLYRDYDSRATRAGQEQLAGAITLGGGGLFVAAALIRFATRGATSKEPPALDVGAKGVTYRGRF